MRAGRLRGLLEVGMGYELFISQERQMLLTIT